MYRTEKLVIRLNGPERAAIERLAKLERLPMSTLARRLVLQEAEWRGIISDRVDSPERNQDASVAHRGQEQ